MGTLIVATRFRGAATTLCTVEVAFGGGTMVGPDSTVLDESFFTIPDGTSSFEIAVQSLTGDAFSFSGTFVDDGLGGFEADDAPPEFEPPSPTTFGGDKAFRIMAHLPELRDATDDSVASLDPPPGRAGVSPPFPITTWGAPPAFSGGSVIGTPCLVGSRLQVMTQTLTASGEMLVLERPVAEPPTRVAVYWPFDVSRDPDAPPTSFLYYFHPTHAQNAVQIRGDPDSPYYVNAGDRHDPITNSTYSDGYDYHFLGLWRYFHYSDATNASGAWAGDPLREDPFWKGIPYQIEASGKPVVAVIALNKVAGNPCDELKSLTDAADLQRLLLDIQAFMFRREVNFNPPGLGRLAMACFSSGHATLSCFLSKPSNLTHPLLTDTLQEVYLFDPHADSAAVLAAPVANTVAWLGTGPVSFPTTKVARLYTQIAPGSLAPVLAQFGMHSAPAPFDISVPANPKISVTCIPLATWTATAPARYHNTGDAHQVMSSVLLTDALRRSGF